METQVDRSHYYNSSYLHPARMASYGYQFRELHDRDCRSVMEVGGGAGLLRYMLEEAGVDVVTLDIDDRLNPDLVGSVTDIPMEVEAVDAAAAFQVLEHLPFDKFEAALTELRRVARGWVVVSLPDVRRTYRFESNLPFIGPVSFSVDVPRRSPPEHEYDGQHYWEIGKNGYPLSRIQEEIDAAGLSIVDDYRSPEWGYHHFFVLKNA